jgi:hypothetical protein
MVDRNLFCVTDSSELFASAPRVLKGAHKSEGPWSLSLISFAINPPLQRSTEEKYTNSAKSSIFIYGSPTLPTNYIRLYSLSKCKSTHLEAVVVVTI